VDAPVRFLRECRRVLLPGGTLVLGLPIEHSLVGLIDGYYASHPGHLYSFSVRCLRQLLARTGFVFGRVFVDVPLAGRFRIMRPVLHAAQHLPPWLTLWWCSALWVVGRKQ
jgi:SAM-dependent methyltransferase